MYLFLVRQVRYILCDPFGQVSFCGLSSQVSFCSPLDQVYCLWFKQAWYIFCGSFGQVFFWSIWPGTLNLRQRDYYELVLLISKSMKFNCHQQYIQIKLVWMIENIGFMNQRCDKVLTDFLAILSETTAIAFPLQDKQTFRVLDLGYYEYVATIDICMPRSFF